MKLSIPPTIDTYEIESELRGTLPRRVRERPYMVAWQRWLTRGAVLLFCFVCWLASTNLRQEHDWLRHQRTVTGSIRSKSVDQSDKTVSYNVVFSYDDREGGVNEGIADVGSGLYGTLKVDGPLAVYFRNDKPWDWRLTPVSAASIAELQANWYFGIGVGTVAIALSLWGLKGYRESRLRLLREGAATAAMVLRRRIAKGSKGETYRYLTYGWTDTRGVERSKEIQVSQAIYDNYPQFAPFTVIYMPNESYGSVPYFLIKEAVVEL